MPNQYTFKAVEVSNTLGIAKRFSKGINNISACSIFEDKTALDGRPVRMKGGQAPSGLVSERGAAGAINSAFITALENGKKGLTIAELLAICEKANTAPDKREDQTDKINAHLKSFVLQADRARAAVNGIVQTVKRNGWNYADIEKTAVLFDGIAWNGRLFKRSTTPATLVVPVVFYAIHFKYTKALAKKLGIAE